MNGQTLKKLNLIIGGLIICSILLFPQFSIKDSLPKFQFIDIFLPGIIILILIQRKSFSKNRIYPFVLLFGGWIMITIIANGRTDQFRDYFELYKLLKFGCVIALFSLLNFEEVFSKILKPVFLVLVVVNMLHYFNVFNINSVIKEYYNGGIHIDMFGLNSIGEPDIKRMLGFAGNPNVNGVIFSLLSVLFLIKSRNNNTNFFLFGLACLMMFLCQSRTNLIALILVMIAYGFLTRPINRNLFKVYGVFLAAFIVSYLVSSNAYMFSLMDSNVVQSNSVMGRLEVWKHLGEMILQKPIFGHGPYKDYFYERNLFPESEFMLQTWRYGFVGIVLFISLLFSPLFSFTNSKSITRSLFVLILIVILVNSITNNPFTSREINVLFASIIGMFISAQNKNEHA